MTQAMEKLNNDPKVKTWTKKLLKEFENWWGKDWHIKGTVQCVDIKEQKDGSAIAEFEFKTLKTKKGKATSKITPSKKQEKRVR